MGSIRQRIPAEYSRTPTYYTWSSMRARCLNPKCHAFPQYGGRGIRICERWLRIENFVADMGLRPSPRHSLDRIDNDGDYEPNNCRWATDKQQMRNRRGGISVTIDGETLPLRDWCDRYGLSYHVVESRRKWGWPVTRWFEPVGAHQRGGRHYGARLTEDSVRDIRRTIGEVSAKDWAARLGVSVNTIFDARRKGSRYWRHVPWD